MPFPAGPLGRPGPRGRRCRRGPSRHLQPPRPLRRRGRSEPVPTIPGPTEHTATSAHDATPTSADTTLTASRSPSTHAPTATAVTRNRAFSARTVSDSETGSAPREAGVRDGDVRPERRADRRDLAVERAADDRHAGQRVDRGLRPPPRWRAASWMEVYGSFMTWAPSSAGSPEPRVRLA